MVISWSGCGDDSEMNIDAVRVPMLQVTFYDIITLEHKAQVTEGSESP